MGTRKFPSWDDGMDSKSIETAAESSDISLEVSSTSPSNGATDVDDSSSTITINFNSNVYWMNQSGSYTTSYTTSGTCPNDMLVLLSKDNFINCHPFNVSISGEKYILSVNGSLSDNTLYKVKVLKKSADANDTTQNSTGTALSADYIFSFTTEN